MTEKNDAPGPEEVLQSILSTAPRPQKVRNLRALHELCRTRLDEGSKDFSIATIGKLLEDAQVMKARGLYNLPALDYRRLIEAWGRHAGPVPKTSKAQPMAGEDYIDKVSDPAARMLLRTLTAERNKLAAQLNTLKAANQFIVDRRPIGSTESRNTRHTPSLTDSELKALKKVLSPEFLRNQGWAEIELGEIVNERGHTLFDPGFATGLRKLLAR